MSFVRRNITNKITLLKSKWDMSSNSITSTPVSVIFFPFMGSKPKHHKPYIQLYEEFYRPYKRPVDIVVVQANILDFLSISRGKRLSSNVKDVMNDHLNPSSKVIVHGMSVGNFLHSVNLEHDKDNVYQRRIAGQIFDSPVYGGPVKSGGIERIIEGIVETTLSKSKMNNQLIRQLLMKLAYLAVMPNVQVFDNYINTFISKSTTAPILTYYSTNDVMLDSVKYEIIIKECKNQGADVTDICLSNSGHAQHIIRHPETFKHHFAKFLSNLKL
jgi:hypothetical protein